MSNNCSNKVQEIDNVQVCKDAKCLGNLRVEIVLELEGELFQIVEEGNDECNKMAAFKFDFFFGNARAAIGV